MVSSSVYDLGSHTRDACAVKVMKWQFVYGVVNKQSYGAYHTRLLASFASISKRPMWRNMFVFVYLSA